MKVNLYATFRLIANTKSLELDLPDGVTVTQAIAAIIKRCPALRPHWWDSAGELHAHVHVILNGEDATTLPEGLNSIVHPQDTLDFFPPVAGGKG